MSTTSVSAPPSRPASVPPPGFRPAPTSGSVAGPAPVAAPAPAPKAARRARPARAPRRAARAEATAAPRSSAATLVLCGVLLPLVAMQLWAIGVDYPLRVTSDVPTYLGLLRGMAAHPLAPQSPYLPTPGIASPHATPYMLALAELWRVVAPAGHALDPRAVGRFLGFMGILVSLATLEMVMRFAFATAGRRAALLTVPVLLVLFGPAHVIWANDLSFNGLLYAGFYPQNAAVALALGALLALRGHGTKSLVLATVLCGLTMVVHPMTGTLLAGLAAADGAVRAVRGEPAAQRASVALTGGFMAGLLWPAYPLNEAMGQSGIPGWVVVGACVLLPWAAGLLRLPLPGRATLTRALTATGRVLTDRRAPLVLALAGAVTVLGLAAWELVLVSRPPTDPLIHTNRLALYWGEDRWRWFLMFAAGAPGLSGLARLAQRREPLPLIWFAGCFGISLLGLAGMPVPVWWRFLLMCQIPLAIGTAVVLAEIATKTTRIISGGTLAFALVFKLATLIALPPTVTYFGSPLQSAYKLGQIIPAQPAGLVATDPFTSYYIPGTTGRRVLTVTKGHVGSPEELAAATSGYVLLHRFVTAPDADWWPSAQALWRAGVRFVLLEKRTSLAPATLVDFSTGPTPLLRTARDQALMGRTHWRLKRVGVLVHDDRDYALYRLDGALIGR